MIMISHFLLVNKDNNTKKSYYGNNALTLAYIDGLQLTWLNFAKRYPTTICRTYWRAYQYQSSVQIQKPIFKNFGGENFDSKIRDFWCV
jgi:hypothetical protein